ncbi:receptor-like protein kinase ANXUR1 [Lotus japonicus]|uniref:receptor-like protein kinase ANXUR1 n=1 Tax=Lotus japonicus TaxID=34305 RepID=UPI002589E349|nr:receptor-like protein kinase ANXUR1 [Lotus japonicus]XP_057450735.1 receptor-like protein kinase ANXUR1 [Lotus japonicus]
MLNLSKFGIMLIKCLCFCRSKHISSPQRRYPTVIEELCPQFSLADLRKSTNNFDDNQIVGGGGLGTVYKGCLNHNGTNECAVAIKRINAITDQEFKEFKNEIELLCQLRHPNLVPLIGFYDGKDEKIIVYEYMANGALHNLLHGTKRERLSWKLRLKICIGAACGLHFLHSGAKRTIFHRDIRPYKILLDDNMVAKLSDLRFSLQGPLFKSKPKPKSILNDNFLGTQGYMAPEILQNKTVTDRCDVYSFGVVLLEMVCSDNLELVKCQQQPMEANIDSEIKGKIAAECWEVYVDVIERCLRLDPNERPSMGEVEVQLELALSLQEEADIRNTNGDHYTLLSSTIIGPSPKTHFSQR